MSGATTQITDERRKEAGPAPRGLWTHACWRSYSGLDFQMHHCTLCLWQEIH